MGKIFAINLTKKLVPRICKEQLRINKKKTDNLIVKYAKDLKSHFKK